jgi:hypothetical protein
MSDVKTMRLASVQLTLPLLEQFMRYQRVLLSELAGATQYDWAGRFAFAHSRALTESGLDGMTQQKVRVLVSEFCGKRSAWLTVRQRIATAQHHVEESKKEGQEAREKDKEVLQRAQSELPRLEDFSEFRHRYGEDAFLLLKSRELELVTLHQDLARIEGAGGHLHLA